MSLRMSSAIVSHISWAPYAKWTETVTDNYRHARFHATTRMPYQPSALGGHISSTLYIKWTKTVISDVYSIFYKKYFNSMQWSYIMIDWCRQLDCLFSMWLRLTQRNHKTHNCWPCVKDLPNAAMNPHYKGQLQVQFRYRFHAMTPSSDMAASYISSLVAQWLIYVSKLGHIV